MARVSRITRVVVALSTQARGSIVNGSCETGTSPQLGLPPNLARTRCKFAIQQPMGYSRFSIFILSTEIAPIVGDSG
jgi:hypothetical protein